MKFRTTFLIFFIINSVFKLNAQEEGNILGETSVNVNYNVSETYRINFTARSRYFLFENKKLIYTQQQFDIFHFSTFKIKKSNRIGLGLYYRNRDLFETGSDEIRIMQQYSYKKHKRQISLGHRFRFEQRIFDTRTIFRSRYRFALNFPLNSNDSNTEAPYIFAAAEGLLSLTDTSKPEFGQRTTAMLAWHIGNHSLFKTGFEYRLENFSNKTENYMFFLSTLSFTL
ncbi:DUF2490 domain-containing protein [Aestuariibaculum sediminum]|uniref:DUF2490 domain-containing protein n=1 Tax=Aestuariibaculum sediminum TaxID=2770637 RepID=A0A8J6Q1H5_9FLAO|nr:DUF2490 domain-containing protein [Aestuariibaculum sediminum]MBD0830966.1 DUF2490 domain-containing protein [Aestuariibaculum sediminum]